MLKTADEFAKCNVIHAFPSSRKELDRKEFTGYGELTMLVCNATCFKRHLCTIS